MTALHHVILHGLEKILVILLEHSANVHARNRHGLKPLDVVVEAGRYHIAKLVVRKVPQLVKACIALVLLGS